jgi:gamma-glutamyl-gamma-aminobutyrate hydrolase
MVGVPHFWTNSLHHQAVRTLATPFRVAATSVDGVVEAIEPKDGHGFFLGVQWHPEALPQADATSRIIYDAFVAACREFAER